MARSMVSRSGRPDDVVVLPCQHDHAVVLSSRANAVGTGLGRCHWSRQHGGGSRPEADKLPIKPRQVGHAGAGSSRDRSNKRYVRGDTVKDAYCERYRPYCPFCIPSEEFQVAISYDLDMATPLPAAHVARELHDAAQSIGLFDASVTLEQVLNEGAATELGTWIRVYESKPRPWNAVITDLGFTPAVSVVFRLDKEGEISDQQDEMIRLVSSVLDRVPGDAVLHKDLEQIWLLRRSGDLNVSEQADLWPPHRLSALSHHYRRATLAFS